MVTGLAAAAKKNTKWWSLIRERRRAKATVAIAQRKDKNTK